MAPKKGSKEAKLRPTVMQAVEWKRLFFESAEFETVEQLVQAAAAGELAETYVEAVLALGHRPRRRHSVAELVTNLHPEGRPL